MRDEQTESEDSKNRKSKRKKITRLEECRMNVDARDTKTKQNIAMSQRRKREEQLENGCRDS